MKKALVFIVTVAVAISFTGCSGSGDESSNSSDGQISLTSNSETDASETIDTPSAEESFPDTTPSEIPNTDSSSKENKGIVDTVEALIGIPFETGGSSPETGFDNSGLIYYVLRENGYINCPRSTYEQKTMGTNIEYNEINPGDLVFFKGEDNGSEEIGFGGIYVGDGKMIYSPFPGEKVKFADITSGYWKEHFSTAVSMS